MHFKNIPLLSEELASGDQWSLHYGNAVTIEETITISTKQTKEPRQEVLLFDVKIEEG